MFPLIDFFGFEIPTYGVITTLGFVLGVVIAMLRGKILGIKKEDVLYSGLYAGIGVIAGAKLLYALINIPEMIEHSGLLTEDFLGWLNIGFGGLVFYGGLIGGVFGVWIYSRQYKIKSWHLIETLIPSVPLMHGIGRIGCFMAGCCYGIPWPAPLGIAFSASLAAPNGVTLFPVQLLEAALNIPLFAGLLIYARKPRDSGKVTGVYLVSYAVIRLITETFRYDEARRFFLGISTSQWISIILLPVGLFLIAAPAVRKRRGDFSGPGS